MDVAMDVIEEVKTANEDRGTRYENLLLFVGAKLVAVFRLRSSTSYTENINVSKQVNILLLKIYLRL